MSPRLDPLRIILVGFGTVGQSLVKALYRDRDRFVRNYGFEPQITSIVDSRGSCTSEEGLDLPSVLKVKEKYGTIGRYLGKGELGSEPKHVISGVDAEVVVETTPTNFENGEPGLSNIETALASGKHVVTTNKGPLALAMPVLLEQASNRRLQLCFSGTVGGGTPFLDFATNCLPEESIVGVRGVLNGTTNYILTRMEESSITLERALSEARERGYSESDATLDLKGLDTAAKLVIISNWVLKRRINLRDVEISGISGISLGQLRKARESGRTLKLVGRLEDSLATVKPEEVKTSDPLCIPGTLNALTYRTEHAGEVTLIGPGTGGECTAGAIIRDLVSIARENRDQLVPAGLVAWNKNHS